jgi:hypothetical protein
MLKNWIWSGLLFGLVFAAPAAGASVQLNPTKDNTLIQQTNPATQLSNGQGDVFVGRTNQDGAGPAVTSIRRGLVAFDVAGNVPAGATITAVTLTMRETSGLNGDRTMELHRALADWGESSSFQNGGAGAPPQNGDATWLYRFYDAGNPGASATWSTPGGDFSAAVSSSVVVSDDLGAGQLFSWTSVGNPQMLADVQSWLDNAASNFGWLLVTDESVAQTVKRLNSGETATAPALEITYVPEPSAVLLAAAGAGILAITATGRRRA